MRRAAAGVLKRSAYLIEGAVAGRSARVVAPAVFARCLRRDVRDGGTGGANLRLFSSGSGEAESGAFVSEKVFHSVANDTLDMLQEKIEAYGEDLDLDGFDLDYSDGVMTVRLGNLGTYVLNKQTPNRQLWLSSPVSGPARFDWVLNENVWVYRRSKAELVSLLEQELSKLLKSPITLKK